MDANPNTTAPDPAQPRWQPLRPMDRRVIGVLAEKAKTTPDIYPMSLNAVCTGCNQKSNRSPIMALEPDDVEPSLDRLREMGVVTLIEGYGRVAKYRHHLYQWLGVDKVELAVMTELLLRGPQTVGELRGRAARMEPIADLAALQPVLDGLKQKGLVLSLTAEGRGHVVTHGLHMPEELAKLRAQHAAGAPSDSPAASPHAVRDVPAGKSVAVPLEQQIIDAIRGDIAELKQRLAQLREDMDQLVAANERIDGELSNLKDALGA
ncbi:MAG: DUF480 domain-containing protein [Patescibacteria group bacterium]|nr:DUF480 domain-containing protein [Patescibacteria group bacterium]